MRFVVIDLIPALLTWEGRDRIGEASVAEGAADTLHDMFHRYRLAGIADAPESTSSLRNILDLHGASEWFGSLSTSASFGPMVNARVIRRLAAVHRFQPEQVAFVTAREPLARSISRSRISVVLTEHAEFHLVPDALMTLESGRVVP